MQSSRSLYTSGMGKGGDKELKTDFFVLCILRVKGICLHLFFDLQCKISSAAISLGRTYVYLHSKLSMPRNVSEH